MTVIICDSPADLARSLSIADVWTAEITGDFLISPVQDGVLVARVLHDPDADPRDWIGADGRRVVVANAHRGHYPDVSDLLRQGGYAERISARDALRLAHAAVGRVDDAAAIIADIRDDWRDDMSMAADPAWWLDHAIAAPVSGQVAPWREYLAAELPERLERAMRDTVRDIADLNDALGKPLPMIYVAGRREDWLVWSDRPADAPAVESAAAAWRAALDGETYCLEWAVCNLVDIEDATGEVLADAADLLERLDGMGSADAEAACKKLLAAGDGDSICGISGADNLERTARDHMPEMSERQAA